MCLGVTAPSVFGASVLAERTVWGESCSERSPPHPATRGLPPEVDPDRADSGQSRQGSRSVPGNTGCVACLFL